MTITQKVEKPGSHKRVLPFVAAAGIFALPLVSVLQAQPPANDSATVARDSVAANSGYSDVLYGPMRIVVQASGDSTAKGNDSVAAKRDSNGLTGLMCGPVKPTVQPGEKTDSARVISIIAGGKQTMIVRNGTNIWPIGTVCDINDTSIKFSDGGDSLAIRHMFLGYADATGVRRNGPIRDTSWEFKYDQPLGIGRGCLIAGQGFEQGTASITIIRARQ